MHTTKLTPQEIAKLNILAKTQDEVNSWSKDRIVALNIRDFAMTCRALKSQSYGSLGERWVCRKLGMTRVTGNKDYDAVSKSGRKYEIKFTISGPGRKFNIVQIRPEADLDFYLIFGINSDNTENIWILSKSEMKRECILLKAGSAHGKFDPATTRELRLSFAEGDNTFRRWNEKYRLTDWPVVV